MNEYISIKDVANYENQEVLIQGWVYNKRSSGKLRFLLIRDGSETIQCVVFKGNVTDKVFDAADQLQQESSCRVIGTVSKDDRAPIGFEIQVREIEII